MTIKELNNKFLDSVLAKCKKHKIKVRLEDSKTVLFDKDQCGGYFCSEEKVLAVAKKNNTATFYSLLAHESSHLDQWVENKYLWDKCSYGYTLFFEWLGGKIVIREHLEEAVQDIIRLELDCELRTLKKIEKYKLPVHPIQYKKKANVYLYSYLYMLETRKWIPQIYSHKELWKAAPSCLRKEYKSIPKRLHMEFKKVYTKPRSLKKLAN